jgi:hypothetical protein
MRRTWIFLLAACALAGCENPEGQTERFLAQAGRAADDERGKMPPLPAFKPREVAPLVIERDPFKR